MRDITGINKIFLLGTIDTEPKMQARGGVAEEYHFVLLTKELHERKREQVEHLEYHNIRVSGSLIPDGVQLYIGRYIHIEGKIHTQGWTDDRGIKRYRTEIIALQVAVPDDMP